MRAAILIGSSKPALNMPGRVGLRRRPRGPPCSGQAVAVVASHVTVGRVGRPDPALRSGAGLEDHVDRGFGGPAKLGVAGLFEDLTQPRLAGLRAECRAYLLGQRVWCADRG